MWYVVMHGLARITTDSDAQSGNGIVVNTQQEAVFVGHFKLERRGTSTLNPIASAEMIGVQTGHHLRFITEISRASPDRNTRLMPRTGQNGVLTFRPIHRKEVQWFVMCIG